MQKLFFEGQCKREQSQTRLSYAECSLSSIFYQLIQVALGVRPYLSHSPSSQEWDELYAMAKKQSLVGVCFAGVQKLVEQQQTPEEMLYLTWMGMAAKIQQRNEVLNRQCVELQKRVSADGMQSCVLKGQGVAMCYPEHLRGLRQSGDIDVFILGGQAIVLAWSKQYNQLLDFDYVHTEAELFDETEVEVHYRYGCIFNLFENKDFQKWCARFKDFETADLGCGCIAVPTYEFNTVYMLHHIFRHLFSEGIGLRQLMDYSFVLRQMVPTEEDKRDFKEIVTSLGMWRFAKAVMWIMQRVFAVPAEHLMCEADENEGAYILAEVMQNGNFGHHDERVSKASGNRYLGTLSRSLQHNWHLASHYPSMIFWSPVWYVYHFFWKRIWKMKHKELFV